MTRIRPKLNAMRIPRSRVDALGVLLPIYIIKFTTTINIQPPRLNQYGTSFFCELLLI